jgi:hypothetical protein
MTFTPGTYFFKDKYSKAYVLVIDGEKVGEVATRKEANKWWEREQRKEVLQVRAMSRAVRGRHYAAIQEYGPGRAVEG